MWDAAAVSSLFNSLTMNPATCNPPAPAGGGSTEGGKLVAALPVKKHDIGIHSEGLFRMFAAQK